MEQTPLLGHFSTEVPSSKTLNKTSNSLTVNSRLLNPEMKMCCSCAFKARAWNDSKPLFCWRGIGPVQYT
ncbi:hypothetical protein SLA2020_410740 [Shorea laevis]